MFFVFQSEDAVEVVVKRNKKPHLGAVRGGSISGSTGSINSGSSNGTKVINGKKLKSKTANKNEQSSSSTFGQRATSEDGDNVATSNEVERAKLL